ncbi:MAG: 3'(2'),5'-bisphosphate nucleotidase CysQ [Verrucomicrobiales bacterium]|nr:3'(2'),5'-bisphosphate nucleotidase CysQ [Verrucomicrobiales bacterium]
MIDSILKIAAEAGTEVLKHYGRVTASAKADQSPLTAADLASHELLARELCRLDPSYPVLSEESEAIDYSTRQAWSRFWLIDPLDGTKEFLKQSGEFTINIALIDQGVPVLGVVYAPVLEQWYWAERGGKALKRCGRALPVEIRVRIPDPDRLTIVASRDHAGPQVAELLARFPKAQTSSMGSSLKFCLVAEGAADVYLRDIPTMEWDTGAAQCVVEAAGGMVADLDGVPLSYNKPQLRNPSLITLGDPRFRWR